MRHPVDHRGQPDHADYHFIAANDTLVDETNLATSTNSTYLQYAHVMVKAVNGAGRYVNRPAYAPYFEAMEKRAELHRPTAVDRAAKAAD